MVFKGHACTNQFRDLLTNDQLNQLLFSFAMVTILSILLNRYNRLKLSQLNQIFYLGDIKDHDPINRIAFSSIKREPFYLLNQLSLLKFNAHDRLRYFGNVSQMLYNANIGRDIQK